MVISSVRRMGANRIVLYVNKIHSFVVEESAWLAGGLSAGDSIAQAQLDDLLTLSSRAEAKRRALSLLSSRSYTRRRLTERLSPHAGREAAEAAVQRMSELGLVDDESYALNFARELYQNRGFAARRIAVELQKHGIDRQLAEQAAAHFDLPDDEPARAEALLRRRYGALDSESARRRAAAFLERCGYAWPSIRAAMKSLDSDETEESPWNTESE